jgi:predicted secreted Zn-dependent protease
MYRRDPCPNDPQCVKIARMSPEELEAFRVKERARLREYHKRRKAA